MMIVYCNNNDCSYQVCAKIMTIIIDDGDGNRCYVDEYNRDLG